MGLGENMVSFGRLFFRMHPDTRDTGGDDDTPRRFQKLPSKLKESGTIRKPESAVAELLKLGRRLLGGAAVPPNGPAPDADSTKLHGIFSILYQLLYYHDPHQRARELRVRHDPHEEMHRRL
jgi:hypothetical protein